MSDGRMRREALRGKDCDSVEFKTDLVIVYPGDLAPIRHRREKQYL